MNFFENLKQINRMSFFNKNLGKSQRYTGFTLAEVLITLGIIGIVAELTIPTLMQNVSDMQTKSGVKVAYSILSQAEISVSSDNGGSLAGLCDWNGTCLKDAFKKYLSYTVDCDNLSTANNCWPTDSKFIDKSTMFSPTISSTYSDAGLVLKNGMNVFFRNHNNTCSYTNADSSNFNCGWVAIDINGFSGPNVVGKDEFGFTIQSNSIKPYGSSGDYGRFLVCDNYSGYYYGFGCTETYISK